MLQGRTGAEGVEEFDHVVVGSGPPRAVADVRAGSAIKAVFLTGS
ncbi:hypothetical protein QZH56_00920 [Streptomyces olivoreticuli]|nr:hypothetical protein [Streptomyces olivoreticuli]WKK24265.1 hypothetical protein QZH56_00920 [Streptomyces olivoreticuli]